MFIGSTNLLDHKTVKRQQMPFLYVPHELIVRPDIALQFVFKFSIDPCGQHSYYTTTEYLF